MNRYLFLLTTEHYSYDEHRGFVVSADTPELARRIANRAAHRWQKGTFIDPKKSKCRKIGLASVKQGVVLSDFHAG